MLNLAQRNPVAVRAAAVGAVTAVVHVGVVTGLVPADVEQPIAGAVDAIGLLALVLWAVPSVTPNAKVLTRVTTDGAVVAGDAAVVDTGTELGVVQDPSGAPLAGYVAVNPELVTH